MDTILRSLQSSLEEQDWKQVREILSSHSLPTFHETGTDTVVSSIGTPSLPSWMENEIECLTDSIQSLFFNANDIPFDVFTLFSRTVDLRHVIPSLRDNYNPKTIMYSCLMHELCLDNKHEAIRLLLSSLPRNVAALEAQRLDYMYIEYMSEETISGFEFVHSPLQAAWEGTLFDTNGQHALDSISTIEDLRNDDHKDITALWRSTMHLMRSVEGYHPLKENNGDKVAWPLLHAIARLGCKGHAAIMWLALKLYPHLIRLKDEHGNLPIHVAAQNSLHYLSQRSQQDNEQDALKNIEGDDDNFFESMRTPTESFLAKGLVPKKLKRWQQPPIIMILQKDPQSAAIPNKDGSLPLHQFILHHDANAVKILEQKAYHDHCISSNSFDGYHMGSFATVKALTCEHPLALTTPDFKTGLHPFLLAASMKTISLDVIYFLLSENPFYIVSHSIFSNCDERTRSSSTSSTISHKKRSLSFFEEEGEAKKKHSLT